MKEIFDDAGLVGHRLDPIRAPVAFEHDLPGTVEYTDHVFGADRDRVAVLDGELGGLAPLTLAHHDAARFPLDPVAGARPALLIHGHPSSSRTRIAYPTTTVFRERPTGETGPTPVSSHRNTAEQ